MDGAELLISRLTAEFSDPAAEQRFRTRDARGTAQQAATGIALAALFNLAFGYNDLVDLGPGPRLWLLLAARGLFAVLAAMGAVRLLRRPERAGSGRTVTLLGAALCGCFLLVVGVRPGSGYWHVMIMEVIILALYLAVPNRFIQAAAVGLGGTAGFGLTLWWAVRPPGLDISRIVLILGAANAAGLLTAYRLSRLRRAEFALLMRAEAMNAELTREVAERLRLEGELLHLASTDVLTGLANRRHFLALANRELARARRGRSPMCVCLLDVDHFKAINDRHGHQVGDTALRAVAAACQAALREVDLIGRFGGEEFTLCLPDTGLAAAATVAERLRRALAALHVETPQGPLSLTVTIGVAQCLWTDADVEQALHRADVALYEGKRAGRDRVVTAAPDVQDAAG